MPAVFLGFHTQTVAELLAEQFTDAEASLLTYQPTNDSLKPLIFLLYTY